MSGVRSAVALLGLHEQDLVLGGLQYLDGFRHRRRVDPIFRVHEKPAAGLDGGAGLVHLLHHALVHERFRHVLADRSLVVAAPEVSGERLLADDVFSCLHGLDDHRRMQRGGRADIDDVDLPVGQQTLEIAMRCADLMLLGKIEHMVAARGNRRHLRVKPIDPPIGVHVQLGNKPTSDKANSDFRHRRSPFREGASYRLRSCAKACAKQFDCVRDSAFISRPGVRDAACNSPRPLKMRLTPG